MPANLSPGYYDAEERFRKAREPQEKIECLEEMLRQIPKHKGTEKMQADIKTRIAKLKRLPRKKTAARGASHMVDKEGAGQVVLLGPPNAGKSALVARLTHATPEVADYPFTTREPVPGMMPFEDIAFQLIDMPPLSEEHIEPWLFDLVRRADLVWIVAQAAESLEAFQMVLSILESKKIQLIRAHDFHRKMRDSTSSGPVTVKPALLVISGVDRPGGRDDVEALGELMEDPWPMLIVSAATGEGLEDLGGKTFAALDLVRVYTKEPGKPADRESPFSFGRGATVGDLARTIHKDVLQKLKFARIWGAETFDGQTVQREHVLHDGDVVELHF